MTLYSLLVKADKHINMLFTCNGDQRTQYTLNFVNNNTILYLLTSAQRDKSGEKEIKRTETAFANILFGCDHGWIPNE